MDKKIKFQRIRMLSALGDFDLALSAADFLYEAEENELYSHVELRRFRCYEHTAIMSYARPFSQSKGKVQKLHLHQCGVKLIGQEKELHERVIKLRNKLVAHSDHEMMNFAAKAHGVDVNSDKPFFALLTQHDEGLQFYRYSEQDALVGLIRKVSFGLYKKLHDLAQSEPKAFDIKVHFPIQ